MRQPAPQRSLDRFASESLGGLSRQELSWLLAPGGHLALLGTRRAEMMLTRVRFVAAVFAVLTPLWALIDAFALRAEPWIWMAGGRMAAGLAFAVLYLGLRPRGDMGEAHRAMWLLFAIPTLFYLYSSMLLDGEAPAGFSGTIAASVSFLPFLMLAGMSIFPLTAAESLALAAPILAANAWVSLRWPAPDVSGVLGLFWLLILIAAVAAFSGMSQLAFIIVLVRQTLRDPLTGCFSRRSGEELLELQFVIARRAKAPLALAFVDLDRFKEVNDRWGHDAGDQVLRQTAESTSASLRTGDILCRWGGEEFVLIMPGTDAPQALVALERLRKSGLARRPDDTPQTASFGLAERIDDRTADAPALVALADARMYLAKRAGRNCVVTRAGVPQGS